MKQARRATLEGFFHEHHVRSAKLLEERLSAIKNATSLTEDIAVITPHRLLAQALADQLRVTLQAIERFDAEISAISQTLPDSSLFRALPGAGAALAPRLLTAILPTCMASSRRRCCGERFSGKAVVRGERAVTVGLFVLAGPGHFSICG